MSLLKSGDLQGLHVFGINNAKLGVVREVFLDSESGQARFLVVEASSLIGNSGKFHPVPWAAARLDPVSNAFQIQIQKDEFKTAPNYSREQLANANFGWSDQSTLFFERIGSGVQG